MFELSVALRYLWPRQHQLSVSIITMLSVFVISCMVWLMLVFFSVTAGLEECWVLKLISMTAPIRVTPQQAYYNSYYYNIDSVSDASNYTHKSLLDKLNSLKSDPYDSNFDMELPDYWPKPVYDEKGELVDIVRETYFSILETDKVKLVDLYEHAVAQLKLRMIREGENGYDQHSVSQACYLLSWNRNHSSDSSFILKNSDADKNNFQHRNEGMASENLSFLDQLPKYDLLGDAIVLPKHFRNSGVLLGDRGYFSYQTFGAGTLQEQRLPVYVAGFYDPGVIPLGGKFIIVNKELVSSINADNEVRDSFLGSGFNVWVDNLKDVAIVQSKIIDNLKKNKLDEYWKVENYREYEFTKDLLQQLQSERNLFTLIAIIIIMVACSNIVSMLILLVNDKRQEIGVLQAMGAKKISIAAIFGFCGFIIGLASALLGSALALLTLYKLHNIVSFLDRIQGHALFNPMFYGESLPNKLNNNVLLYVFIATILMSTIAGLIPAIKACLLKPAKILRSE